MKPVLNIKSVVQRSVCGLASLAACSAAVAAAPYAITDLGTLGGTISRAYALNDGGQVVGESGTAGGHDRAFLWEAGVMTHLGIMPGDSHSRGVDINDAGHAAVLSEYQDPYTGWEMGHALLWADGEIWLYGSWESNLVIRGLTDDDVAFGTGSEGYWGPMQGFRSAIYEFLWFVPEGLQGDSSVITAMNGAGLSVGWACYGENEVAFTLIGSDYEYLASLGGDRARALDVNDNDEIIGIAQGSEGGDHAVLWTRSEPIDLGTFAPAAINNATQVVGALGSSAVLWEGGELIDLNESIPAECGWHLLHASDINDAGQIVGWGVNPDGETHGFLLTVLHAADLNADGFIDGLDLLMLLDSWGDCPDPPQACPGDIDDSSAVDVVDLFALLAAWGPYR